MLQITTKEFNDKFKTNPNVEVLTKSFFDAWIEDNREVLVKAEKGEETPGPAVPALIVVLISALVIFSRRT